LIGLLVAFVVASTTVSVVSTLAAPLIPTIAADRRIPLDSALGRLGDGAERRRALRGGSPPRHPAVGVTADT
jgi:hypothetical protein